MNERTRSRRRSGLAGAVLGAALVVSASGCTEHSGATEGSLVAGVARRGMEVRALVGGAPLPEIATPEIEVRVGAPGYDPASVEAMITGPVEEALKSTPGLDSIASTSTEGAARFTLRFAAEVEPEAALVEVRRRLEALDALPEDADRPLVLLQGGASEVALWYVLRSRDLASRELMEFDERALVRPLQALPGVLGVERCGVREEVVVVAVDLARLAAMGLSLRAVEDALRGALVAAPAGVGLAIDELGALRIAGPAGASGLELRDVAEIGLDDEPPVCAAYSDSGGHVVVGALRARAPAGARAALHEVLTAASEAAPPSLEIIRLDPDETLEIPLRVAVRGDRQGEAEPALAAEIQRALADLGHRPWALELGSDGESSPLPAGEGRLLVRADAGAMAEVVAALRRIPGIDSRPVGGAARTAAVFVRGDDLASLREVSGALAGSLRAIPGVADAAVVGDDMRPELTVRVDAARAAAVGVEAAEVRRAVTAVLSGIEVGSGLPGARPRVLLRAQTLAADADDRVAKIAEAVIPRSDPGGGVVPVTAVAEIVMEASPGAIRRSVGRRSVTIELTLDGAEAEAGAVDAAIKEALAEQALPAGVTVEQPARPSWWSR